MKWSLLAALLMMLSPSSGQAGEIKARHQKGEVLMAVRAPGELEPKLAPETEDAPVKERSLTLFGGLVQVDDELERDIDDQGRDLAIEWDEWRNKFSQEVQMSVSQQLGFAAINLPEDTTTWYHCQVTADRRVINAEITHCSGTLWFDKALLESVRSLDGRLMLTYPQGSHRRVVSFDLGIIRQANPIQRKLHFGDVEHQRVSSSTP